MTGILKIHRIGDLCMSVNLHANGWPRTAIEKTRQSPALADPGKPVATPAIPNAARGVLRSEGAAEGKFLHVRIAPAASLAPWVERFWMVEWDLREAQPRLQETLPHPNVYLLFEQRLDEPVPSVLPSRAAEIAGVHTGKFSKRLEGWSRVFGVKFRPGGFRAFLGRATASLTNRVLPAEVLFGPAVLDLAARLYGCADAAGMSEATAAFLSAQQPERDAAAELSAELVERVARDPEIVTVQQLAVHAGMAARSLQRLFREYVGVPPKWVIRRYRLHELIDRLHSGATFDGARVAQELGYADQAHLINDFRRLVGYTPVGYRKRADAARPAATRGVQRPNSEGRDQ